MRQVDNSYQNIRAQAGAYYEYRIVLGGNYYGMNQLRSINIDSALFEGNGPQIGNAYSAQCTVKLLEESANWPRMAQFDVEARLCSENGNQQSRWFSLGRFYTDTRYDDTFGSLSIQAFDGMLKLEKSWTDKIPSEQLPTSWPISSRAYASMIQTANLAQFEDLTQLDNTVSLVGLDTSTTIRDVLKTIAAANGGNWYMTANEKLRLVKFRNPPEITVEATTADYVYLGKAMKSLDRSPALAGISAVRLETIGGTVAYAGDDTGYQLNGNCEFSDTNGVAELCLENVSGYVYKPFTASNAYLDPITEPGDFVVADGNAYQVMRLSWRLGKKPVATIAADYDQEIDHEYTITSAQAKQYRKVMAAADEKIGDLQDEFSTAIQQTERQINLIAESTVTQTEFEAVVESLQSQIDGNIQSWSGNVVPTLNNSPAIDWTTDAQKAEHVGDTYFVNTDAGIPEAGQYYRFENNDGVYSWQLLDDSALSEALNRAAAALAAAEDAQDTADSASATAALKGRIFVNQPTPPYSVGDLWFDSAQSEIMTCMTARASGSFNSSDWVKRNKYTDDSAFEAFQTEFNATITAVQNQLDQKAETYYQEADPAAEWGAAIAGIAVAGVTVIGISGGAGHGGDLWYRTSDNTTWFFDESKNAWVQQDVPDEVFDKIDGKAQIFIAEPYPPYNVGDLWFDSNKSEIMTCIRARNTGNFVSSDWEKRNKYTDDTAANAVGERLTSFQSEFTVQPNQIRAEVEKRVIADHDESKASFGWLLDETSHTWYSNGQEVMKVNSSGLEVKGKITATSGYIGNSSNGFTIQASSIYNGKSSLTANSNGVYIGTNGIALGSQASDKIHSKFQVDSNGNLYATSATIEGSVKITSGSINIGNGAFYVDSNGNLSASNGTFEGNVYAKNIQYGGSTYGTLPGAAISTGTITAGATGQLSSGVVTSLGYANAYNSATTPNTGTYPAYFCAGQVVARSSFYSSTYNISLGGDTEGTINNHTHQISADSDGVVTIGAPDFLGNPHSFNIADTAFYKAAISAREITAITHVSEWTSVDDIIYKDSDKTVSGLFTLTAKHNDVGLKLVSNQKFTIPATKAYDAGVKSANVNNFIVVANTASYYPIGDGHYLKCKVQGNVTGRLADGSVYTSDWTELDVYKYLYAEPVYEAGYSNGETDFKPTAISASRETSDANVVWDSANKTISANFTLTAKNAAETTVHSQQEYAITLPATKAYNAGVTAGQAVGAESVIVSSAGGVTYSGEYDFNPTISYSRTSYSEGYLYGAVNVKLSNDKTYTLYVKMGGNKAYNAGYQAHYDEGYHYTEEEVSQIRSDEWSAGYITGRDNALSNVQTRLYARMNDNAVIGGTRVYHTSVWPVTWVNGQEYKWGSEYYVYLTYDVGAGYVS